ncbi:MAG: laccase domain-containing protein, partial [Campylobacterales bacterium]|nr:laccase domain-containing protein [Campylobacterales bacterium]
DAGVLDIDISDDCSCCKSELYFSYRAKKQTGRFCGVVMLKESK